MTVFAMPGPSFLVRAVLKIEVTSKISVNYFGETQVYLQMARLIDPPRDLMAINAPAVIAIRAAGVLS